jgi:hypothetical protein
MTGQVAGPGESLQRRRRREKGTYPYFRHVASGRNSSSQVSRAYLQGAYQPQPKSFVLPERELTMLLSPDVGQKVILSLASNIAHLPDLQPSNSPLQNGYA